MTKANVYSFDVLFSVYKHYEIEAASEEEATTKLKADLSDQDSIYEELREELENYCSIGVDVEFVECTGEVEYD